MKKVRLPGILKTEFVRNALILISGTSFAQGFAIAIYLILTRIYTPEDFGLFALYMSILSITMIFSTAKYELSIMLPDNDEDAKDAENAGDAGGDKINSKRRRDADADAKPNYNISKIGKAVRRASARRAAVKPDVKPVRKRVQQVQKVREIL